MSAKSDLRAAVDVGVSVGVVATLLDVSKTILVLPRHLDRGFAVFIDSGAFTAFQKAEPVDWPRVFRAYESVITMTDRPEGLSIVAPDVIGDQVQTLALWELHAKRVRSWIDGGARVIVPLQCGQLSAGELLEKAKRIFGTYKLCAGIPSNLSAMPPADCATLHHHDFHILGRVVMTEELRQKMAALQANNPLANFTADANWLRSRTRKLSLPEARIPNTSGMPHDSRRTRAVKRLLISEAYQVG